MYVLPLLFYYVWPHTKIKIKQIFLLSLCIIFASIT